MWNQSERTTCYRHSVQVNTSDAEILEVVETLSKNARHGDDDSYPDVPVEGYLECLTLRMT